MRRSSNLYPFLEGSLGNPCTRRHRRREAFWAHIPISFQTKNASTRLFFSIVTTVMYPENLSIKVTKYDESPMDLTDMGRHTSE